MTLGDPIREHYAAIGVVAAEWANFEALIDYHAIKLAGLAEDFGACFTAQISGIGRKLDAYISVARYLGCKEIVQDLTDFATSSGRLSERRNRIIHDPWSIYGDGKTKRFEITARKILRYAFIEVPTEDVWKCVEDIRSYVSEFEKLNERVIAEVHTSSEIP